MAVFGTRMLWLLLLPRLSHCARVVDESRAEIDSGGMENATHTRARILPFFLKFLPEGTRLPEGNDYKLCCPGEFVDWTEHRDDKGTVTYHPKAIEGLEEHTVSDAQCMESCLHGYKDTPDTRTHAILGKSRLRFPRYLSRCMAVAQTFHVDRFTARTYVPTKKGRMEVTPKPGMLGMMADFEVLGDNGKVVLFLYPAEDHNGAFDLKDQLCERLLCWKSRSFSVISIRVKDVNQAMMVLSKIEDRSLYQVVIGGHGSKEVLSFGKGILKVGDPKTDEFLEVLKYKLDFRAHVFLDSCLNAGLNMLGLKHNLFSHVATKLEGAATVKASTYSLSDDMMHPGMGGDCIAADTMKINGGKTDKGGIPKCKILRPEDFERVYSEAVPCLTGCGASCEQAEAELKERLANTPGIDGFGLIPTELKDDQSVGAEYKRCQYMGISWNTFAVSRNTCQLVKVSDSIAGS